jgi:hypothetical protein
MPQYIPFPFPAPAPLQFADANPVPVQVPVPAANPVPVAAPAPALDLAPAAAGEPVINLAPPAPVIDLAPPAAAPPAAAAPPQPNLPLAHQPSNKDWPVHDVGGMNIACSDCGALHWLSERLTSSSKIRPKFGTCCFSGKVHLSGLHNPPPELLDLLRGQDHISTDFRNNIRNYNNALAMTSLGCQQDYAINSTGQGPYVFKIHGSQYHHTGPLIPAQGRAPNYAQLYIYESDQALEYRMGHRANAGLHRGTMQILQNMLYHLHPAVPCISMLLKLLKICQQTSTAELLCDLLMTKIVIGTIFLLQLN